MQFTDKITKIKQGLVFKEEIIGKKQQEEINKKLLSKYHFHKSLDVPNKYPISYFKPKSLKKTTVKNIFLYSFNWGNLKVLIFELKNSVRHSNHVG